MTNMTNMSRKSFLKLITCSGLSAAISSRSSTYRFLDGLVLESSVDERTSRRRRKIMEQGYATQIPVFEFHDDEYEMMGGRISMNPDYFKDIMDYFKDQDIWSLNSEEVAGYIKGDLMMPAKSVILTSDTDYDSRDKIERMTPVLKNTGMHFILFLWTHDMSEDESVLCKNNGCWNFFNDMKGSGMYSFGTHTETHRHMNQLSYEDGIKEIMQSKNEIEDNLGEKVNLIAWPFESIPKWAPRLEEYGFDGGFAGNSRFGMNVVVPNDPDVWTLPRILPPNPRTRVSGRPAGLNIDQIIDTYREGKKVIMSKNPNMMMMIYDFLFNERIHYIR